MQQSPAHLKSYVRQALRDEALRSAVLNATQSTAHTRAGIIAQTPYWEELRSAAHAIKKDVIGNLDHYLLEFERRCGDNSITVHWAADAAEARNIILELARQKQVQTIVKSKSLTSEEVHLNPALEGAGLEVLETDLGEYIVQLMGQIPSHLIIPALHLKRQQIGRLFHEKLGVPYSEDPVDLLAVARSRLREKFLAADMGISGANFALSRAGTIVVVENEANAHLTTALPRIHVALFGIEKLLRDFSDLPVFLKLLAPSATGQKTSTYVNFIGGAAGRRYGEGPQEVHFVLLDNGRSAIVADEQLRETLYCIRCAACLNACPVYQQIGGHAYGWVYMGPIGSTLIPQYLGKIEGSQAPFLSTLCGACYEVCPLKIDLPRHLLKLRQQVVQDGPKRALERLGMKFWAGIAARPLLYRWLTKLPAFAQRFWPGAMPVPGYTGKRRFGRFDRLGFRSRYQREIKK